MLKGDQVNWDEEYRADVVTKLRALKHAKASLDEEEADLETKQDPDFPLLALPPALDRLTAQLEELEAHLEQGRITFPAFEERRTELVGTLRARRSTLARYVVELEAVIDKKKTRLGTLKKDLKRTKKRLAGSTAPKATIEAQTDDIRREIRATKRDVATLKELARQAKT